MKTIIKQKLFIILLLCCVSMKAQDRLGYCGLQVGKDILDSYDVRLEKILHDHLSEDFLIRCIFTPSFDPECILQVERIPELECYQIITLSFEKNLWYHKNDTIGISMDTMCLEKDKALGLINLTNLFIKNKSNYFELKCLDGETTQFEINDCGEKLCGAIDCPDDNSLTGRLVKIYDILRTCVIRGTTKYEVFNLIKSLYDEAFDYYSN